MCRHDLGELERLLVAFDVLETESHPRRPPAESGSPCRPQRARQQGPIKRSLRLSFRKASPADALDGVLQMRVADAHYDLLDVGILRGLVDPAALASDEVRGLAERLAHLGVDVAVLERIVDGALPPVVAW